MPKITRRKFLRTSAGTVVAVSSLLVGFDGIGWRPSASGGKDPFQGGKQLGTLEFLEESQTPMDTVLGRELDGRLYTDLSGLTPQNLITPTEKFYIRTRASEFLEGQKPWSIRVGGMIKQRFTLTVRDLENIVNPVGLHLMECAGNVRAAHFGMLSVADWTGAPLSDVLNVAEVDPRSTRVLISGFDRYSMRSTTSIPGASWIFTLEELTSSNAFLATKINGQPLPADHGAPVRLVVPGWYGCTCIKWVNEITFVDDKVEATSQMQEYATRTFQRGVPKLAKDYRPALIDQAATPIRVEKWLVNGKIKYRVVGIAWGGSGPVRVLEIQFNPGEHYVPVDSFKQTPNDSWNLWTHAWTPTKRGTYVIRLRVKDPLVPYGRLDRGVYARAIETTEI